MKPIFLSFTKAAREPVESELYISNIKYFEPLANTHTTRIVFADDVVVTVGETFDEVRQKITKALGG